MLFTAIQTIEVSVRTKIIKHFSPGFGAFWFMDETFALNDDRFATNLAVIRKEVSRSHDDFITEHFRKYSEPDFPPVWKRWKLFQWVHYPNFILTFRMLPLNMP